MHIVPRVLLTLGIARLAAGVVVEVSEKDGEHLINEGVADAAPDQDELTTTTEGSEPVDPPSAEEPETPAVMPPPAPVKGAAARN